MQPVLDAEIARHPEFAPHLRGVDLAPVLAFARELLADEPTHETRLRAALAERFPDLHAGGRGLRLPLPPAAGAGAAARGLGTHGQVTLTPLDAWLGRPLGTATVARRRRAALPGRVRAGDRGRRRRLVAAHRDARGARRLAPRPADFRDERGRELFDLPDGAARPTPTRRRRCASCPSTTTSLLSHADRTPVRVRRGPPLRRAAAGPYKGGVLVDGRVRAIWHTEPGAPKGGRPSSSPTTR